MILNEIGEIAQKYWNEISNHFPFIQLDEMVVMPNHIHGILVIDKTTNHHHNHHPVETPKLGVSTTFNSTTTNSTTTFNPTKTTNSFTKSNLSTSNSTKKPKPSTTKKTRNKNHNPEWKPGTIGVIINQHKRICTIKSRKRIPEFGKQSRFHDRIIRDTNELHRIQNYIIKNSEIWDYDKNK